VRIAVLDRQTPFATRDRDDGSAGRLCRALCERGHEAALVRLPFDVVAPETIVDQMLAVRLLSLEGVDRVIALAFPAYYVRHDERVVWALDGHGPVSDGLPNTVLGRCVRRAVLAAERSFLAESRRIHAPSAAAAGRLRADTGLDAEVLRIPRGEAGWPDAAEALAR
jgi:hypothetical protein